MKALHYGSDRVLVDDEIAEALLELATLLAGSAEAQVIAVPIWSANRVERFEMVVGPASHLSVHESPPDQPGVDLRDADALSTIQAAIVRRTPHSVQPAEQIDDSALKFDDSF